MFKPHRQRAASVLMVINLPSARNEKVVHTVPLYAVKAEATGSFINAIKSMTFPLSQASQQVQQLPKEVQSHFTSVHAYMIITSPHSSAGCYSQLASCTTLFLYAG